MSLDTIRRHAAYRAHLVRYAARDMVHRVVARLVVSSLLGDRTADEPTALRTRNAGSAVVIDAYPDGDDTTVRMGLDDRLVHLSGAQALDLARELAHRVGEADRRG